MSLIESFRRQLVPIHRDGYLFIAGFVVLTLLLHWLWSPLGWIGAALTIWCVYFFRDPPRVSPMREGLILSPADGVVCSIGLFAPPPELGLSERPMRRISIFMSVFDCHVNRAPISGRIQRIVYSPGLFLNADLDKASEDNERNGLVIETPDGRLGVVQIAGLIARRIVSFVHEGETIEAGDRFGLIRFGSRVDVYLSDSVIPLIGLGARAIAGETVLADLRSGEEPRSFKAS